jgi:hypothetical protein
LEKQVVIAMIDPVQQLRSFMQRIGDYFRSIFAS